MSQTITRPTERSVVRQPCVSLKEIREDLEAPIREARDALRDAATKEIAAVRAAAADYAEEGRELCAKYRQNAAAFIQGKPIQALLVAAALGVVTGAVAGFISRRR